MITFEEINDFQKELENSYIIPITGIENCTTREEGFNNRLMAAVECCIQLKLYLKDILVQFGYEEVKHEKIS